MNKSAMPGALLVMIVALVGTTITPYMQVYIQSAVAEKGVTSREYRYERFEVIVGSVFAILTAGAIMICMAATLWASGHGAALLALETLGLLPDLTQAPFAFCRVFEPDAQRHPVYQAARRRQAVLYERLVRQSLSD